MGIVQCANKHFYDNQKFDECPHCKRNASVDSELNFDSDKTVAKYSSNSFGNNNPTVNKGSSSINSDSGKTESIYFKNKNSNPVSGWLVCVEGENKGKSFDLHIGKNSVGRSMKSDVVINDPHISRENHFSVIYEPISCKFYILTGASVIHLNNAMLENSRELEENDVITAGESKFVFVPFCKEGRDWND